MTDLHRLQSVLTSTHHLWRFTHHSQLPSTPSGSMTVVEALTELLPHIPKDSWPERLAWGGICLNGQMISEDQTVSLPCLIEYFEPKFALSDAATIFGQFSRDLIIHEDDDLIAVYKPPRLSCAECREQRHHYLKAYVESYLGSEIHMPSRLDTSAQGLVVMSKSKRMHRHLQQAFERHAIEKYYLLHLSNPVTWSRKLVDNQIDKDPRHPILRRVVSGGGLRARTFFRVIAEETSDDGLTTPVVLAKPETGRTHQLRVQTADLGSPIVGDNFYGGRVSAELRLLSLRVKFYNQLTKKQVEIVVPERLLPSWVNAAHIVRDEPIPPL